MVGNGGGAGLYSPRVASRIARIRYQNFQAWAKAHLIHATPKPVGAKRLESIYSFYDLLLMRLIQRLRAQGAKPKGIKTALKTIEMMSQGEPHAWRNTMLLYDVESKVVVVTFSEKPDWNPIAAFKGPQKMAVVFFPQLIEELKDELVPQQFPHVEIDPEVLGGAPVIRGKRISTRAVMSVIESGADARVAYPSLSVEEVADAEAYEKFLAGA